MTFPFDYALTLECRRIWGHISRMEMLAHLSRLSGEQRIYRHAREIPNRLAIQMVRKLRALPQQVA